MSTDGNQRRRRRPLRLIVSVLVLGVIVGAVVLFVPGLLRGLQGGNSLLPQLSECTVTADDTTGLDRDAAKRATTAVALSARGLDGPYASDIDDAVMQQLAEGPSDDAGPSLACRGQAASDLPEQEPTDTGLTPRAEEVREAIGEVFGDLPVGGFAPGGVEHGHREDSTHYDGRAIDVFFRPVSEEHRREGWILAHWLIAHANELDIQYVIFDDRVWSAHSRQGQWHDYEVADPDNEILRHLDHVHVDVLGGDAAD